MYFTLRKLMKDNYKRFYIDIRNSHELSNGCIPDSKHIPLDKLKTSIHMHPDTFLKTFGFKKFTKNDDIYFYSQSGIKSRHAVLLFRHFNYNAFDLNGGYNGWRKEYSRFL